jgi:hypothetical protein
MIVLSVNDQPDGGVMLEIELTMEERDALIEFALIEAFKRLAGIDTK